MERVAQQFLDTTLWAGQSVMLLVAPLGQAQGRRLTFTRMMMVVVMLVLSSLSFLGATVLA